MVSETSSPDTTGHPRPTADAPVLVALLGEIALRRDDALAPVPGTRARLLVAALATHPGRSRSAQALIDDIWGDDPPRAPMNALHTQVSRLRATLPEGVLEIGPAGYRLLLDPDQVDLTRAQQLETRARQAHNAGDDTTCLALIATARSLWRGEPAADLPAGSVADELTSVAAARHQALDTLELAARELIGDLPGAIALARNAVAAQPFDEPAHGTLMRLLAASGRTNEALDVFASLRTRLVEQLGADPGAALTALNTAILRGEPIPGVHSAHGQFAAAGRPGYARDDARTGAILDGPPVNRAPAAPGNATDRSRADALPPDSSPPDGYGDVSGRTASDTADRAAVQSHSTERGTGPDNRWQSDVAEARGETTVEPAVAQGSRLARGGAASISNSVEQGAAAYGSPESHGIPAARGWMSTEDVATEQYPEDSPLSPARGPGQQPFPVERAGGGERAGIGLRVAPNPLLGREADLEALQRLLRTSRVTTVLGPGGTGKTRVVNELGARVAREKPVVLVELASLRADSNPADTRADVETAIAATLGVTEISRDTNVLRPVPARDIRQRLRDALGTRPMLLILDNCEHLIDAVAEVVADLIGATDRLTVLTTSRAPLEITAETVYPLPPLVIDAHGSPATDLFAARARAVRPSVRLDPEVVARLCRTLDGLPLAIELAAARVRTMSVEEIETRLEHRFALLRSGDRSSPERHRTLHAVIEWSWNLLDKEQRAALRRLCRFTAGFTLRAAESVIEDDEIRDAATAVDGLVGQSLLTVLDDDPELGSVRYRMLETVREFGEEQLELTGEADLVMDRMSCWARDFVYDVARRYPTSEQVGVVLEMSTEQENLIAVLRYALDRQDVATANMVFAVLAGLWVMRGAHMELVSWSPRLLALPPQRGSLTTEQADLLMFAQLLLGLHLMFVQTGLRDAAVVRTRVRRLLNGDTSLTPVFRFLGELAAGTSAVTAVARKLAEGARSDDPRIKVSSLLLRANMRENAGDVYGSNHDALRALRVEGAYDLWGTAMVCQHLGSMYGQSARYAESVDYYRRTIDIMQRLRAHEEVVEMRSYLAVSLVGIGDTAQARRELEATLGMVGLGLVADYSSAPPNQRSATVVAGLAEIELAEGDIEAGLQHFRQVLTLLDWPNGQVAPGPGDLMLASAVVDAYVLHGRAPEMDQVVRELLDLAVPRLVQYWDLPQIGAVACAVGTHLLGVGRHPERALNLLALAPRVFGRQDYPSMRMRRHQDLHRATVGDQRMTDAVNAVAGLGRRTAAARIMDDMKVIHAADCL
ncbi:AfsR/SARP family transcriptional regulator [Nocardia huaxiensis]|uniref:AfsR/SARP family transcriptional regulator n=1 Tax=Nocardia huaxiensis TaxID=2755382 RepID=UPI001E35E9DA|nr:BTAD domain-containing putative transcriptional regulator [Nocardia huaxiensis]UFS93993.1 AAA family ATPase [Nocardia huaxiensis]